MSVIIAPNMKRSRVLIDSSGNELDPKTKQIIKRNVPDYIPTKEEIEAKINIPAQPVPIPEVVKANNPLAEIIKKQVQEQVQKTLAEINVAQMVKDAIEEAFK